MQDDCLEPTHAKADALQLARGLAREAFLEYTQGNLRKARQSGIDSLALMSEQLGDSWETGAARCYLARSRFLMGETQAAAAVSADLWKMHRVTGDPRVSFSALTDWARAEGGRIPVAELDVGMGETWVERAAVAFASGFWHLGRGDAARAAGSFATSREISGGKELANDYVARLCWETTAWRLALSTAPPGAGTVRREYLRAALAASRRAVSQVWRAPVHRAHALREAAILAAEQGRERKARSLFAEALRHSVEQENLYDFAFAVYERGRVGRLLKWPDAEQNLDDGRQAFRAIGLDPSPLEAHGIPTLLTVERLPSPSLADRFQGVIESGRRIVSCLTTGEVLDAVRSAAIDLLRPQHCRIVPSDEGAGVTIVGPGEGDGRARSTLYTSLTVHGRPVARLVVSHDEVEGYFQEEERKLATFLSALGSAALENAEGYETVTSLTESLREQGEQLRVAVEEKDVMLREIQQRVRSNLQLILSLLGVHGEQTTDSEAAREFLDITNRVRAMALIHDFVRPDDRHSEIQMLDYLRSLMENLRVVFSTALDGVAVTLDLSPLILPMTTAVECGMVVNELVTNAFRHAFPAGRRGHLRVCLESNESLASIRVIDDGVGTDPRQFEAPTSLGLLLVVQLVKKMRGSVRARAGVGTDVEIVLPIAVQGSVASADS